MGARSFTGVITAAVLWLLLVPGAVASSQQATSSPILAADPNPLIWDTTGSKSITFSNVGSGTISFTTETYPAPASGWVIESDNCYFRHLGPGDSCNVSFNFTGVNCTVCGHYYAVTTNGGNITVPLLNGSITYPDLSTSSLSFGNVTTGTTSAAHRVTVYNDSHAPMTLTTFDTSSSPFAVTGGTCAASYTIPTDGTCTVDYRFSPAADGAFTGSFRIGTSGGTRTILAYGTGTSTADSTPPTITASATSNGSPYTVGTWTNHAVVVHFDCTDGGSGVASVSSDQTISTQGAGQSVTGSCTDNAGNSASATFSGIQIDTTAPSVTASAGSYVAGTLTNQPVTVHFSCTDGGGSGVASVTGDQTVSGGGTGQSVTGTCTDAAGNSSSATFSNIDVDTTPPAVTATAWSYVAGTWTAQDVVVHFDCSDASGVSFVTPDQTITTEGAGQSVTGTCTDNAGNSSSATFSNIQIDKTPPSITASAGGYVAGTISRDPVVVHFDCTDGGSGVASVTGDQTVSANGPGQSVSGTCTDNAGNSATATFSNIDVEIDTTPPSITASATSNGSPYVAGTWTNAPVVVHFDCTDSGSGVASVSPDQTIATEGAGQSVTGSCSDNAGNSATATFSSIQIDLTAPSIAATAGSYVSGTPTNQPVVVHFDCTDGGSGVASVTGDQTVSAEGAGQSVTGTCTDAAGNSASATFSGIDIDLTPPTITASAGGYISGSWTNQDVVVHFACTDASGVASVSPGQTVSAEGAGQSVTGTCTDNAGNSASATFADIRIDKTAPTITASAGSYVTGTWTNQSVVVHFDCTDAASGVASVTVDKTVATEGSGQSAFGTCVDVAGNAASATFGGIQIDKSAPTVTYTGNAGTYSLTDQVSITCAATDALSGIASTTCANVTGPAWSFGAGPHTSSATATDNAGNTGHGATTFTVGVTFAGLEALVSQFCTNPGIANSLNAKLQAAQSSKARGQTKTEQNQIGAFDNEVSAQTGKCLTPAQATLLIQFAAAL